MDDQEKDYVRFLLALLGAGADLPSHSPASLLPAQPESKHGPQPSSSPGNRVLVVEDDNASRTAMRYLLAQAGWQASDAGSLAEGKALLATFDPHAIILDLMLPDGNGADLLGYIRTQGLPIRVAVITGVGDPAILDAVRQLRPDVLLRKPINVKAFLEWLESVRT